MLVKIQYICFFRVKQELENILSGRIGNLAGMVPDMKGNSASSHQLSRILPEKVILKKKSSSANDLPTEFQNSLKWESVNLDSIE